MRTCCTDHVAPLYSQNLAPTPPTSGRPQSVYFACGLKAMEVLVFLFVPIYTKFIKPSHPLKSHRAFLSYLGTCIFFHGCSSLVCIIFLSFRIPIFPFLPENQNAEWASSMPAFPSLPIALQLIFHSASNIAVHFHVFIFIFIHASKVSSWAAKYGCSVALVLF